MSTTAAGASSASWRSVVASAKEAIEPEAPAPPPPDLTDAEIERYSRQLVLPEWGAAAQLAVSEASVLVIGAGALGAPVALYLAGAGVGRIGILDDDEVELSNLHRQLLHFTPDIGDPEGRERRREAALPEPGHRVEPYQVRAEAGERARAGRGAGPGGRLLGLVRHPLRRQRRLLRGPRAARGGRRARHVGAGDEHQARPHGVLPLRVPRRAADAPRCADAGVLGPAAGVIGSLQALEALKLLTGVAPAIADGFLQVDLATTRVPARARGAAGGLPRLRRGVAVRRGYSCP